MQRTYIYIYICTNMWSISPEISLNICALSMHTYMLCICMYVCMRRYIHICVYVSRNIETKTQMYPMILKSLEALYLRLRPKTLYAWLRMTPTGCGRKC